MDLLEVFDDRLHGALRDASAAGRTAVSESTGAVVVLRHEDVERLAHDRRIEGIGLAIFDLLGVPDGPLRDWYRGLMFTNEGAVHHRLRSLVSRAFTPRSANALRGDAARMAAEALAPVESAGGGDLAAALALLPMRVMCRLLGVPEEDVAVFGAWVDDLSPIFGIMTPEQIGAAGTAVEQLLAYVDDLAGRRRETPGDDLITGLLAAEDDGGRLDHDEVVAMVANLLVAGHDTTASQLGCSCLTLVRHPEAVEQVRADPELVGPAVTETLRYEPGIAAVPRTVAEAVDLDGEELAAGTVVLLSSAAANREVGVWRDPDRFDVERFTDPATPRLLTFGAGPHYCLGAALARITVEEGVRALVDLEPFEADGDPWAVPWRSVLGRAPERVPIRMR